MLSSSPHTHEQERAALQDKYVSLVIEANKKLNLTRIVDENQTRILHIEDSLSALWELNDAPPGLYGDMGSGGGFPGVMLAIESGRPTVLIESVRKKADAVSHILQECGLSEQIRVCNQRIEEVTCEMRGQFSVLTARALSSLPSLVELASPLLKQGGVLICYKSQNVEDEKKQAEKMSALVGMKERSSRKFCLSDNETRREIITYERIGESKIPLPRKMGMAQKHPLSL